MMSSFWNALQSTLTLQQLIQRSSPRRRCSTVAIPDKFSTKKSPKSCWLVFMPGFCFACPLPPPLGLYQCDGSELAALFYALKDRGCIFPLWSFKKKKKKQPFIQGRTRFSGFTEVEAKRHGCANDTPERCAQTPQPHQQLCAPAWQEATALLGFCIHQWLPAGSVLPSPVPQKV